MAAGTKLQTNMDQNRYKHKFTDSCTALLVTLAKDLSDSSRMYEQGTLRACVLLQRGFQTKPCMLGFLTKGIVYAVAVVRPRRENV